MNVPLRKICITGTLRTIDSTNAGFPHFRTNRPKSAYVETALVETALVETALVETAL